MPFCGAELEVGGESISSFDKLLNVEGEPMSEDDIGFLDRSRGFGFLDNLNGKRYVIVLWFEYPDDKIIRAMLALEKEEDVENWIRTRGIGSEGDRCKFPICKIMLDFFQK